MPDRLVALLAGWATRRNVLFLIALELVMTVALLPLTTARLAVLSGGATPLDTRYTYTPDQAYAALTAYGPAGRDFAFNTQLTVGLAYPIIYSLFFSLATLYFLQRAAPGHTALARLALLPFLALVVDYLENGGLMTLLWDYPEHLPALAVATSVLTTTKWILLGLCLLILAASGVSALLARRQRADPAHP